MNDNEKEMIASQDATAEDTVTEYEGMPKWKESLFKALPLIITLACVGLFALGIKWVAGIFYMPEDTLYERTDGGESYKIVHCYQNPPVLITSTRTASRSMKRSTRMWARRMRTRISRTFPRCTSFSTRPLSARRRYLSKSCARVMDWWYSSLMSSYCTALRVSTEYSLR